MKLKTVQKLVTQKKELQADTTQDLGKLTFNNMRYSMISKALMIFMLLTTLPVLARVGGESGGGGDASEIRVNEIRSDLLNWINKGGSRALALPANITFEEYERKMKDILQHHKVALGFLEKDSEINDELKVSVNGIPKTCRGFISSGNNLPTIICNISRFSSTSQQDQYKLIHHEYAGLTGIESNMGASSDYIISLQLTDYLVEEMVLKLSVKNDASTTCPASRPLDKHILALNKSLVGELSTYIDGSRKLIWKTPNCSIDAKSFLRQLNARFYNVSELYLDNGLACNLSIPTVSNFSELRRKNYIKQAGALIDFYCKTGQESGIGQVIVSETLDKMKIIFNQ